MNNLSYITETAKGIQKIDLEDSLFTGRKIFIQDTILPETAVNFVQAMLHLSETDEPISIYINSSGGEVTSGLLIYDVIQSCKNEINMYCIGTASSMAALILASGQKGRRFILPHSRVMIHEVLLGTGVTGSATSISKLSESIMETRDITNSLLAKHTGKTLEEINRATSFDNVMNAGQAVEFGICDKIVEGIF